MAFDSSLLVIPFTSHICSHIASLLFLRFSSSSSSPARISSSNDSASDILVEITSAAFSMVVSISEINLVLKSNLSPMSRVFDASFLISSRYVRAISFRPALAAFFALSANFMTLVALLFTVPNTLLFLICSMPDETSPGQNCL